MEESFKIVNNMPNWYRQNSRGDARRSNYESFYPVYERIERTRKNRDYQEEMITDTFCEAVKNLDLDILIVLSKYAIRHSIVINYGHDGDMFNEIWDIVSNLQKELDTFINRSKNITTGEDKLKLTIEICSTIKRYLGILIIDDYYENMDLFGLDIFGKIKEIKNFLFDDSQTTEDISHKEARIKGAMKFFKGNMSTTSRVNNKVCEKRAREIWDSFFLGDFIKLIWVDFYFYLDGKDKEAIFYLDKEKILNLLIDSPDSFENLEERINQILEKRQNKRNLAIESRYSGKSKEEILHILESSSGEITISDIKYLNLEWTDDEKRELFFVALKTGKIEEYPFENECIDNYLEWIEEYFKKYEKGLYRRCCLEVRERLNPLYNSDLNSYLEFDVLPWMKDSIKSLTQEDIENQHNLLIEIYIMLDTIGAIEHGCKLDDIETYENLNIEGRLIRLDSETDRIQITANLLFYLNKLTKLSIAMMYYKVLDCKHEVKFKYDEELEKKIANSDSEDLSDEESLYLRTREKAEKIGNLIVNTVRYLYGNDPELYSDGSIVFDRPSNYQRIVMEAKKIKDENHSRASISVGSFTDFLELWAQNFRKNQDNLLISGKNGPLDDFYCQFNELILNIENGPEYLLKGDFYSKYDFIGYNPEDLVENFLFCSRTLDSMNRLYELKILLIQQLIEYAKDPAYKDQIAVQIEKSSNPTEHTTNDKVYILVDGLQVPLSFHTNLALFPDIENLPTVSPIVKSFSNRNSVNVIYPMSKEERTEFINEHEQTEEKGRIIELIHKIKNGEYKAITNPKFINGGQNYTKKINVINEFIRDVINIDGTMERKELMQIVAVIKDENGLRINEKIMEIIEEKLNQDKPINNNEQYRALLRIATILINRSTFKPNNEVRYFKDSKEGIELAKLIEYIKEYRELTKEEKQDEELRLAFAKGLNAIKDFIGYEEVDRDLLIQENISTLSTEERITIETIVDAVGIERAIETLNERYIQYAIEYSNNKPKRISAQDIGKATYDADSQTCEEAQAVIDELINQREDETR